MIYPTRHMIALQPMRYMGRELTAGDPFEPTEVDAGYFEQQGTARPAPIAPAVPVASIAPQVQTTPEAPRRGRPPKSAQALSESAKTPVADATATDVPPTAGDAQAEPTPIVVGMSDIG